MEYIIEVIHLVTYIFLGVFQGVTEPLPISSSGHLILLQDLLNIHLPGLSFEIIVHFGSLIAIIFMYKRDIFRLIAHSWKYIWGKNEAYYKDFKFSCLLIIATIPAGVIGLLFEDVLSNTLSTSAVVGGTLMITGIFLWIIRNIHGTKEDMHLSLKDAIIIGSAQAIALIPGISRSGATIVAALLVGVERDTALRFSFLLFIPVSIGSIIFSIKDIVKDPTIHQLAIPFTIAWLASIIATYVALKWFIHIMKKGNLLYFALYCLITGSLVLLFL